MKNLILAAVAACVASFCSGAEKVLLDNVAWTSAAKWSDKSFKLPLQDADGELLLTGEMWATDIVKGSKPHENARVQITFHDAKGKQTGGWPRAHAVLEGSRAWHPIELKWSVPFGATEGRLALCNWGTKGTCGFRNIKIVRTRGRMLEKGNAPLPSGCDADVWSLNGAWKSQSASRVRYSLNGLWAARPIFDDDKVGIVPGDKDRWGWGKIPALWWDAAPWNHANQNFIFSPWMLDHGEKIPKIIDHCWYRRRFQIPAEAKDKRVSLWFDLVNNAATVYVDGKKAGEAMFPGGEVDLTPFVTAGKEHTIDVYVSALMINWTLGALFAGEQNTARAKKQALAACRGITGDLFLDLTPKTPIIDEAYVETSVEKGEITFCVALRNGVKSVGKLSATVKGLGFEKTFEGGAATVDALGTVRFTAPWKDAKLWDIHAPQNMYSCTITADGDTSLPFRFGFREIRQVGRDWLLNGKPIHLKSLYCGSSKASASFNRKEGCLEFCRKAKADAFNSFIAGNYDCQAGSVSYLEGIASACDETGILYAYTLPHVKEFKNDLAKPEIAARYEGVTREFIRRARNHPSIVFYAMNHNHTGYTQEQNPSRMDGVEKPVPAHADHAKRRAAAEIAAEIAKKLDPTRVVYHHCSGLLSNVHNTECYLNWAPIQERADWMEQWSTKSVVPHYIVEFGMPLTMSWFSYRWPHHIIPARAYQSCWAAEYAAPIVGEKAYVLDEPLKRITSREEELWKRSPFGYYELERHMHALTNTYHEVLCKTTEETWKGFRGWKLTGVLPWAQNDFYDFVGNRDGNGFNPHDPTYSPDRFKNLKGLGPVPCWNRKSRGDYWSYLGEKKDYRRSVWGEAFHLLNREEIAFIGGGEVFTEKDHHFTANEKFRKKLVIVNDCREDREVRWTAKCGPDQRSGTVSVKAGDVAFVPVEFTAPAKSGKYQLAADFVFSDGEQRSDKFGFEVYAPIKTAAVANVILYDTKGLTRKELDRLGLAYRLVNDLDELHSIVTTNKGFRLIVGRESLTRHLFDRFLVPNPNRFSEYHGSVLVFEQSYRQLTDVGFRTQEYGLRNVFSRWTDKQFAKLDADELRDWNGEATLTTPYNTSIRKDDSRYFTEEWGPFQNTRTWRCRNRGNVASVIPEKPGAGSWRPLLDGAFNLEYAPLLEWAAMYGRIIFCQLDVTARTRNDPVADNMIRRLYARLGERGQTWRAQPQVLGFDAIWHAHNSFMFLNSDPCLLPPSKPPYLTLIASSGAKMPKDFKANVETGMTAILLGFSAEEVKAWSPVPLKCENVTNAWVNPIIAKPPEELNGLSAADFYLHGRVDFAAFTEPTEDGNEVFRVVKYGKGKVVFWQLPPWKIDSERRPYLRVSRRRANSMFGLLLNNLGVKFNPRAVFYSDNQFSDDDPYRYWRW